MARQATGLQEVVVVGRLSNFSRRRLWVLRKLSLLALVVLEGLLVATTPVQRVATRRLDL